ncbi:MAG: UDP-3-O-(3-hydroxymyristoyl)glucosamine N-acyltransferase [Phycisphaerales bacterium]
MSLTLAELAEKIGAKLQPASVGSHRVSACATLADAADDQISFLVNPRYASQLTATRAAAVIVSPRAAAIDDRTLLIADDPYFAFQQALMLLHGSRIHPHPLPSDISPLASIHPSARIGQNVVIHPFVVVCEQAVIGDRCILYPHVFLGPHARIGEDGQLFPSVTLYDHCSLGRRATLHAGCSIGHDGFGYATHAGIHHKLPAVGNVVIGDDVEMGANCQVDRATIGSTTIGSGTKFSNNVTIGHGCKIGRHNLFVAQVGLAGSVTTGDYVVLGGQVGVAGHITIGDRAQIAAKSGIMTDIPPDSQWGGQPAQPLADAKRTILAAQRVPNLLARIKKLERKLQHL